LQAFSYRNIFPISQGLRVISKYQITDPTKSSGPKLDASFWSVCWNAANGKVWKYIK
jgi:hypothetical protein